MSSTMPSKRMKHVVGSSCLSAGTVVMFMVFLTCSCQTEFPKCTWTFYLTDNYILQNHVIQTTTVSSPVICSRECSMDATCVSFNYKTNENLCELNNETRKQNPCDFTRLSETSYYDGDGATSFLSEADSTKYNSCQELLTAGHRDNGIYTIYPAGLTTGLLVYCDMETDEGGWIVFQRRQDGSVDFYRTWDEYKHGFGNLCGEFWLGNEALRSLTQTGQWKLRVDLCDYDGNTAWAGYGEFAISGEKYTLHVGSFNDHSTAGDSMAYHSGQNFTTKDQDNDKMKNSNCAIIQESSWWFDSCSLSDLNSRYYNQSGSPLNKGLRWFTWISDFKNSFKSCSMKLWRVI